MVRNLGLFVALTLAAGLAVADDFIVTVGPGMVFVPSSLSIRQGDTVTWQFVDDNHTTTSNATTGVDSWDSGVLNDLDSFSHTFFTAGTHRYYCAVHSSPNGSAMNGEIVVQAFGIPSVSSFSPTEGPTTGGTTVTIEGEDFADDCTVAFGSIGAAETVFVSGQLLRAVTPPSPPGTVAVSVSCSGGTDTSPGFTFVLAAEGANVPAASTFMLVLFAVSLGAVALLLIRRA